MESPKIGLTIFLLRSEQVAGFEHWLAGVQPPAALSLSDPLDGVFLPLPSTPHQPPWVDEVRSLLQAPGALALNSQSPAGLLVVRRNGRTFVVTFGHSWQKLEDQWLEPDFGRRVALNSIARNQLVEIRAEQVFAKWHLANERAPKATSVTEFNVEFDRDLVAAVEGVPSDQALGKSVRGGTSLRLKLPISQLASILDKSIQLFGSDAYKKTWPEFDNLTPVRDQALTAKLETQLDVELQSGAAAKTLVMFTPAQRRDETLVVDSYVYGRMAQPAVMRPYLTVDSWLDFVKGKGDTPSVDEAKGTPVHLLDEGDEEIKSCSAFDCFGYELSLGGQQYVLSSGVWYHVVGEFVARINKIVKGIDSPSVAPLAWNQVESEGEYNTRCAKQPGFLHFDAKNVMFGGGQSKFEFCDLLHLKKRTLYFAKIASKSSGMSHLVEQVRRTSELFFSADGAYRRRLAKVVAKQHPKVDLDWLDVRPRAGDWNLCLVSLGRPAPKLPFFAKCGLAKLHKDLTERGHGISFFAA
jgi:uncharacterized protein (TIGR04141 family)